MEQATRGQASNQAWMEARKGCITASIIGQIYSIRAKTDPHRLVGEINQQTNKNLSHVPAIAHGIKFEDAAKQYYELRFGVNIEARGFMLHPVYPWLGASTDGYIAQSHSSVEIKCPMPVDGIKQLIQLCNVRKSWFLVNDEGKLRLNVKHKYYFQCQLQIACLEVRQCIFIEYLYEGDGTFLDLHSEVVFRDDNLISSLIDKAKLFHEKYLA